MSRDIKFRAWSTGKNNHLKKERMISFKEISQKWHLYQFLNPDSYGVILMQYTGLKDKNGVDIYEGDIVVWKVNDIVRTAPVYFDELQASFWMGKDKDSGHLVLNDWMRGEHEVIGNIHQNPELL